MVEGRNASPKIKFNQEVKSKLRQQDFLQAVSILQALLL
jgi:hypothetical protein